MDPSWLGRLRLSLTDPPSLSSWEHLLSLFLDGPLDPELFSIGVDYAVSHLTAWPDELRLIHSHHLDNLADLPPHGLLRLARNIDLTGTRLDDDALERLLSLDLDTLSHLSLNKSLIGPHRLKRLLDAPWTHNLRSLSLSENRLKDVGLLSITDSTSLSSSLSHLNLASNGISDDALYNWSLEVDDELRWSQLRHLDLSFNRLSSLFPFGAFTSLNSLSLQGNSRIGDGGILELDSDLSKHLTQLNLAFCGITPVAISWLARMNIASSLTTLNLSDNPLGDDAIAPLSLFSNLSHLYLQRCALTPAELSSLTSSPTLRKLESLNLAGNGFSSSGVDALLRQPSLLHIKHLDLSNNNIDLRGAQRLADAAPASLRRLILNGNPLTPQGIEALASSPRLSGLTSLSFNMHIGRLGHRAILRSPHLSTSLKLNHIKHLHLQPLIHLTQDLLRPLTSNDADLLRNALSDWIKDTSGEPS